MLSFPAKIILFLEILLTWILGFCIRARQLLAHLGHTFTPASLSGMFVLWLEQTFFSAIDSAFTDYSQSGRTCLLLELADLIRIRLYLVLKLLNWKGKNFWDMLPFLFLSVVHSSLVLYNLFYLKLMAWLVISLILHLTILFLLIAGFLKTASYDCCLWFPFS